MNKKSEVAIKKKREHNITVIQFFQVTTGWGQ